MNVDLCDYISYQSLECLNQRPEKPAGNALKQGYRDQEDLVLESDADEQLLLNIEFGQKLKHVSSMVIKGPADSGPKRIKLYANRGHMGFSDVSSTPAAMELQLTAEQLTSGDAIQLKMVKFTFCTNITIFVEDNQTGTETTKVSKIALYGQSGEGMDVSAIKKVDDK
mmetsp:Transcript_6395/g.17061  ORF Transcript_6395/g.17061 Transcript_6395/m.17061 type:complete len:168 (+) Transcript_6395:75-578(+)|eukprot:CAMPEP_0202338538 /NCGR_PEP_ID=MMETSP1126-20121109/775_1 /ASSEMBLY_ACC=CAM_ASM_000457 /TAXON_ID=3047 /ORGANISM="Dunaliella tertiolecta, Strain CCMP1320" /LENGTH=167 /DNA_ID=CAMNT_0048928939 /DNA_START=41 /DNA_END=544 /DNA_ORIENTATION=+